MPRPRARASPIRRVPRTRRPTRIATANARPAVARTVSCHESSRAIVLAKFARATPPRNSPAKAGGHLSPPPLLASRHDSDWLNSAILQELDRDPQLCIQRRQTVRADLPNFVVLAARARVVDQRVGILHHRSDRANLLRQELVLRDGGTVIDPSAAAHARSRLQVEHEILRPMALLGSVRLPA